MNFPITIDFSPSNSKLHKDVTEATRKALIQGWLRPGDRLPSAKEMGKQLGVSRTTMVKVYQQLVAEGYLETRVGSGTFVRQTVAAESQVPDLQKESAIDVAVDFRSVPNADSNAVDLTERLSDYGQEISMYESARVISSEASPLGFALPAPEVLPARQWQQVLSLHCRLISSAAEIDEFGYQPLKKSVASYLRLTKAVDCSPEQIVIFSDAQRALQFISTILIGRNDRVILENPSDIATRNGLLAAGAEIVSVGVDEDGLITDELIALQSAYKALYVSSAHHHPTGAVLASKRRESLMEWARQSGAIIVEDGRDSDYYYGRGAQPALHGLDREGRVIYLYDFCRVLYPLSTTAVIVLPHSMIEPARRAMRMLGPSMPSIEQFALSDFIKEGDLQRHIRRSRAVYQCRRQALVYNLTQRLLDHVSIPNHSAGLHQLVEFNLPMDESDILECAELADLPMISTRHFYENPVSIGEFLIPFSLLDTKIVPAKIEMFAGLLKHMQERKQETGPAACIEAVFDDERDAIIGPLSMDMPSEMFLGE